MSHWNPEANEIFLNACELPAGAVRAAYLDRACGDNGALRADVESMFAAEARSDDFLERSPSALLGQPTPIARPGDSIGHYTLLEQLGEGGMGVVFRAAQSHPVRREVAIKIIKAGPAPQSVIARFEIERQALALMDHPHIAKVFDAGQTDSGLPYFVMELVRGLPITVYCDQYHLNLRARLQLFASVCRAIQHAHQKGIIHRDLKPANVIVCETAEGPVPKVIDFGVAKSTGPKLSDRTMHTEQGEILGTLEYMSPEQAELNPLEVDTRSDVYGLGVLLYELLTGSTPFQRGERQGGSLLAALQRIREHDPPPPSRRLDGHPDVQAIASMRSTDAHKLTQAYRGELDWLVMKALQKQRSLRYQTASELLHDIECYLNDLPVSARPTSTLYRVWRWCRKNPYLAGFISLTAVLMATIAVGSTMTAYRLMHLNQSITDAQQKTAQAERERRAELARAYISRAAAAPLGEARTGAEAIRAALKAVPWTELSAADRRAMIDAAIPCVVASQLQVVSQRNIISNQNSNYFLGVDVDPGFNLVVTSSPDAEVTQLQRLDGTGNAKQLINSARGALLTPSVRVFSPDGRYLLEMSYRIGSASDQGFSVWDLKTNRLIFQRVQSGIVNKPAFHPDGKQIMIPHSDGRTLHRYSLESGDLVDSSPARFRDVRCEYSADAKYLAIGSRDLPTEVVNAETWETIASFPEIGGVTSLAWHPKRPVLVVGTTDGHLYSWNAAARSAPERIPYPHLDAVHRLVFSPDGRWLASGEADTRQAFFVRRFDDHHIVVTGVGCPIRFSPDNARLALLTGIELIVCKLEESLVYRRLDISFESCTFSPDNRWLAMAGLHGVWLYDSNSLQRIANLGLDECGPVAFHPDGRSLTTFGYFSQVHNWPIAPESIGPPQKIQYSSIEAIGLHPQHRGRYCQWSPDGRYLVIGNYRYGETILWDSQTQTSQKVVSDAQTIQVAISPNNEWLVTNSINTGKVIVHSMAHAHVPDKVLTGFTFALNPSGTMLAIRDGGLSLRSGLNWEVSHSVALPAPLDDHAVPPAFQPKGPLLAVSVGHDVLLLRQTTGELVATLNDRNKSRVRWLSFSSDGLQLAITHSDFVAIWNLANLSAGLHKLGPVVDELPARSADLSTIQAPAASTEVKVDRGTLRAEGRWYELWEIMARSESRQGNYPDAIDDLNRAWRQVPDDPLIRATLLGRRGLFHRRNLSPALALRDWSAALLLVHDQPDALTGIAQLSVYGPPAHRDPQQAISLAALLASDPETRSLGQLLTAAARIRLGIADAENRSVLETVSADAESDEHNLLPDDLRAVARYFLCLDLLRTNEREAARLAFEQAVAWHVGLPSSFPDCDRQDLDRLREEVRQQLDSGAGAATNAEAGHN